MVYEARLNKTLFYAAIGGLLLLSLLGFVIAGVIPTESTRNGAYPLMGWAFVAVCFAGAAYLWLQLRSDPVKARADASGLWIAKATAAPIPWADIQRVSLMPVHVRGANLSIVRFKLRDPSVIRRGGAASLLAAGDKLFDDSDIGLNLSRLRPGTRELMATIAHYRPDLV